MSACHERFLDIPGYPGYKIGDRGTVISYSQKVPRVLKPWRNQSRNWEIHLYRGVTRICHSVGRLVLLTFVGPPPEGMECCHGPRGRSCHHLDNLSWGTRKKNVMDMLRDGTLPQGERNGQAKLTEEAVRSIREEYALGGISQRELGRKHGVTNSVISYVVNRKIWKHVR